MVTVEVPGVAVDDKVGMLTFDGEGVVEGVVEGVDDKVGMLIVDREAVVEGVVEGLVEGVVLYTKEYCGKSLQCTVLDPPSLSTL